MKASSPALLFTCEHGGNQVPEEFRDLFRKGKRAIASHRGLDKGALETARAMSRRLGVPLIYSEISRLLIDLNRSLHHRAVFSEFSRDCTTATRTRIIDAYYRPYRDQVEAFIKDAISSRRSLVHLSFHSFTPRLENIERNADIGLLYDPSRNREKIISRQLQKRIRSSSNLVVRLNYPYRGNADGLTTALRKKYNDRHYAGIELEVNQKYIGARRRQLPAIIDVLAEAIQSINPT